MKHFRQIFKSDKRRPATRLSKITLNVENPISWTCDNRQYLTRASSFSLFLSCKNWDCKQTKCEKSYNSSSVFRRWPPSLILFIARADPQMAHPVLFVWSWNELCERFSKVCEHPRAGSAARQLAYYPADTPRSWSRWSSAGPASSCPIFPSLSIAAFSPLDAIIPRCPKAIFSNRFCGLPWLAARRLKGR